MLIAVLLSACSHTSVQMSSGSGTTTVSTGVSVNYSGSGSGSAAAWALIGIGLIAAEYARSAAARERGLEPERAAPRGLDATRQVNEVDCTRPIENWSANLKCK
ncbi:MAG: hypothetical protein OEV97_18800 [Betaproteobacteria bacterium]|nr:hypothetical protein [Betaproteobacteria bacterium]